jgi:cytochrome c oxidase subunit 2
MSKLLDIGQLLGFPPMASEHGPKVDHLIIYLHWVMGILFVGWMAYFVYVLFRFRKSRHPKADYTGYRGNATNWLEVAVAVVEGVLLIGLALPGWAFVVEKFPEEKDSTVIQVVAQQFGWNAFYPGTNGVPARRDITLVNATNAFGIDESDPNGKDDVKTFNYIIVPVDKPVIAYLSSMDVIHSFKLLPQRVNQDATPGIRVPVHFKPNKLGKYQIVCAQLCGNGHFSMRGVFEVKTQAEYAKWLSDEVERKMKAGGPSSFE